MNACFSDFENCTCNCGKLSKNVYMQIFVYHPIGFKTIYTRNCVPHPIAKPFVKNEFTLKRYKVY